MADPQQIVDDALAGPSTVPATPPVAPPFPAASADMPAEPVVSVASPITPPPVEPVAPVVTTTTTTTNVPMGDETPLAFVAQAPSTLTSPPPTTTTTTTTLAEPGYVPPAPQDMPKKKGGSKILMTLLGIFALLATLGVGGYYAYQQFVPKQIAQIAELDQAHCGQCDSQNYETRWDNQRNKCVETHTRCGDNGQPEPSPIDTSLNTKEKCEANGAGNPGFWCGKIPDGTCGGFCNTSAATTCDQLLQQQCNYTPTRGASCTYNAGASKFPNIWVKSCGDCGDNNTYWFDRTGMCHTSTANGAPDTGLCAIKNQCSRDLDVNGNPDNGGTGQLYTCDSNGCSLTAAGIAAKYTVEKWRCNRITNLAGGCQDGTPAIGNSQTFSATCGAEQIDVQNGGTVVDFRSKTYPTACGTTTASPSPSPSPNAPVLACTGLTKNVTDAALRLGSPITFTCAGTVTPATAGTVSYQFRYMIGTGAWTTLATLTGGKTASLTPTQCGVQYQVQCRACATLSGVKKCDPVWQGVAP